MFWRYFIFLSFVAICCHVLSCIVLACELYFLCCRLLHCMVKHGVLCALQLLSYHMFSHYVLSYYILLCWVIVRLVFAWIIISCFVLVLVSSCDAFICCGVLSCPVLPPLLLCIQDSHTQKLPENIAGKYLGTMDSMEKMNSWFKLIGIGVNILTIGDDFVLVWINWHKQTVGVGNSWYTFVRHAWTKHGLTKYMQRYSIK